MEVSKLLLSDIHLCISVFSIVSTPRCLIKQRLRIQRSVSFFDPVLLVRQYT